MNDIYHRTYRLEFDVWDPQQKSVNDELDKIMFDLKARVLLPHAGNVKLTPISEERVTPRAEITLDNPGNP